MMSTTGGLKSKENQMINDGYGTIVVDDMMLIIIIIIITVTDSDQLPKVGRGASFVFLLSAVLPVHCVLFRQYVVRQCFFLLPVRPPGHSLLLYVKMKPEYNKYLNHDRDSAELDTFSINVQRYSHNHV